MQVHTYSHPPACVKLSPRVPNIFILKHEVLQLLKRIGRNKECHLQEFSIFLSQKFLCSANRSQIYDVLPQEPLICFYTSLSPLSRSFSLMLFSPETLSFLLFLSHPFYFSDSGAGQRVGAGATGGATQTISLRIFSVYI
jgi:hypothetical protein